MKNKHLTPLKTILHLCRVRQTYWWGKRKCRRKHLQVGDKLRRIKFVIIYLDASGTVSVCILVQLS